MQIVAQVVFECFRVYQTGMPSSANPVFNSMTNQMRCIAGGDVQNDAGRRDIHIHCAIEVSFGYGENTQHIRNGTGITTGVQCEGYSVECVSICDMQGWLKRTFNGNLYIPALRHHTKSSRKL